MKKAIICFCGVLAVSLCANVTPVFADDGSARIGASGITFVKNNDISMIKEILAISTSHINAEYWLMNDSQKDLKTTMAFPMPAYCSTSSEYDQCPEAPTKVFSTLVDGQAVDAKQVRQAMLKGKDITNDLRALGLTDLQLFFIASGKEQQEKRRKVPICFFTDSGQEYVLSDKQKTGLYQLKALDDYGCPAWTVVQTYYWDLDIPAKKTVHIEHDYDYSPYAGSAYDPGNGSLLFQNRSNDEACLNDGTGDRIESRIQALKAKTGRVWVDVHSVEYILWTARTWKGPIGEFVLRIKMDPDIAKKFKNPEKHRPEQFLSLCFPGKPKLIDSLTYEFTQENYVPPDKLVVYFYDADAF